MQFANAGVAFEAGEIVFTRVDVGVPLLTELGPVGVDDRVDIGNPVRRPTPRIVIRLRPHKRLARARPDRRVAGAGLAEARRAEKQPRIARILAVHAALVQRRHKRPLGCGVLFVSEQHHAEAVGKLAIGSVVRRFAQNRDRLLVLAGLAPQLRQKHEVFLHALHIAGVHFTLKQRGAAIRIVEERIILNQRQDFIFRFDEACAIGHLKNRERFPVFVLHRIGAGKLRPVALVLRPVIDHALKQGRALGVVPKLRIDKVQQIEIAFARLGAHAGDRLFRGAHSRTVIRRRNLGVGGGEQVIGVGIDRHAAGPGELNPLVKPADRRLILFSLEIQLGDVIAQLIVPRRRQAVCVQRRLKVAERACIILKVDFDVGAQLING